MHFLNQKSNLFNYFWPFLNVSDNWRHIKTMQRLVESTSSQKAVRMILASILSLYHIQLSHYLQMVSGIRWPQFYPIRDISESVYVSYILFPPPQTKFYLSMLSDTKHWSHFSQLKEEETMMTKECPHLLINLHPPAPIWTLYLLEAITETQSGSIQETGQRAMIMQMASYQRTLSHTGLYSKD